MQTKSFSRFLMLVVSICFGSIVCGQTVESSLHQFDRESNAAHANLFFRALQKGDFLDEEVVFRDDTPVDSLRQQVWYWAAEWFYDRQQYETATQYGLKALPLFHPANDSKADCLNLLGLVYVRQGDFKNAARYAKECLEIDMRSGDDDRISSSLNTVAGIYMAGYQAKEAEQYILQALEHAEKADNPARMAVILGMASEIYHTLGNDQEALAYADRAYQADSLLGRQPQAAIRQSQKASALLGLHRYQEAENLLRRVLPVLREAGDYHSLAIALNRLGMALLCQKRQQEAIPYYREAAGWFSKMGDLYNEIHAHRGLYESYWTLNPDSAKIELDYFDLLKDSLYSHSTAEALSRYNAEFGNEQLLQENRQVRTAHYYTIVGGAILLLLVILTACVVVRAVRLRERRRIADLMREIERLKEEKPSEAEEDEQEESPKEQISDEDRLFLLRVISVVNNGFSTGQLGVEVIASQMNMSVQTFRRRLQAAAGETPKAFISAIQMEKACKLLRANPEMPVIQVAAQCGFDEASTFAHTFKRVMGSTPTQYREQQG